MENLLSKSIEQTSVVAKKIVDYISKKETGSACVVTLTGDLGTGKTTLTQEISKHLGIKDRIKSPTFLIMESYPINFGRYHKFIHIDAYRLKSETELENLGFKSLLRDKENLIVIEWPEKVARLIPEDSIRVSIVFIDDKTREISFK